MPTRVVSPEVNPKINRRMALLHGFYVLMCLAVTSLADKRQETTVPNTYSASNIDRRDVSKVKAKMVPESSQNPGLSTSNLMTENSNSVRISKCTHLYFTRTTPSGNQKEEENCTNFNIEFLNDILQNQYLEITINKDCILNKTRDSSPNFVTLTLGVGDVNSSDVALANLHNHVETHQGHQNTQQHSRNDVNSSGIHISDKFNEQWRIDSALNDMQEVKALLESLKNIQSIILNSMDLESYGKRIHNLTDEFLEHHSFDKDTSDIAELEVYLTELQMEVQSIKTLKTLLVLQNFSGLLEIPWVRCLLAVERWESELAEERLRYKQVQLMRSKVHVLKMFRKYVDPAVYFTILTVGLAWNGVLLLMFARHRHLWTSPNIMLFNLAVADILSLVLNLLLFYFAHYYVPHFQMHESICKFYITVRPLSVALSALSVVALSVLRYVATGQSFTVHSKQEVCHLSTRARIILYIATVWLLSLALALPYSFVIVFSKGTCFRYGDGVVAKMVTLFEFTFYCVALPSIVIVFNSLTANGLRQSTKDIPTAMRHSGQDHVRNRSANVLMALVIVFLISYVPHYLWRVLHRWLDLDVWEVHYRCIDKITYYLLFANCCFNPISLYIVSGMFRKMFNYYFFYFYYKNFNEQSMPELDRRRSSSLVYMNSVRA